MPRVVVRDRSVLPTALILVLVVVGLATLWGGPVALALPFVTYLAVGLLQGPEEVELEAHRVVETDRTSTHEETRVRVTVRNVGEALEQVRIADEVPEGLEVTDGAAAEVVALGAGEEVLLEYTVRGGRGAYRWERVLVSAAPPLGLRPRAITVQAESTLLVVPRSQRLPGPGIQPRRALGVPGLYRARQGGPGVEFHGVREYRPGDARRWLNARACARHPHTLFVNEFEVERAVDVGLVVDARAETHAAAAGEELFEHTIAAATMVAETLLAEGNRVGLLLYGGPLDWTLPSYGKVQRERILRALARARLRDSRVFQRLDNVPSRLFATRAQLIFVSPLGPRDPVDLLRLRARGHEVAVISPDAVSHDASALADDSPTAALAERLARLERQVLFRELLRGGVGVFSWDVDVPFRQAALSLKRPQAWLHSPGAPR